MDDQMIDRDLLATYLHATIDEKHLSMRAAALEIGCSLATLSRLLKGSLAPNYPDSTTLLKAVSWLGKSLSDFETGQGTVKPSSLAEAEVHLRALPGLTAKDKEALVGMVKAAYDAAHQLRKKTK